MTAPAIPTQLCATASTLDIRTDLPPPNGPVDFARVPAKRGVYLLRDADGAPVLLATGANLRALLQRKLTELPPDQHSRRIPYGEFCRQVEVFRVNSPFAANLLYFELARQIYPTSYPELILWERPWFVQAHIHQPHPRIVKTQTPRPGAGPAAGPIPSQTAAAKLLESLEDMFDLCRYHNILRQAPAAEACAYKEMGKCPAPCDGSIGMDDYRRQIQQAIALARDLAAARTPAGSGHLNRWKAAVEEKMRTFASALRFERAAGCRWALERAGPLEGQTYCDVGGAEHFGGLFLQPGKGVRYIEPFLILGGKIEAMGAFHRSELPAAAPGWFDRLRGADGRGSDGPAAAIHPMMETADLFRMGLVVYHDQRRGDEPGHFVNKASLATAEDLTSAVAAYAGRESPPTTVA